MKKNILFLINTLSVGGAEKVLINIVNGLDKEKYNITIHMIFGRRELLHLLDPEIEVKITFPYSTKYTDALLYKFFSKVLTPRLLYSFFVRKKYDIEIAFLEGLPTKIISGGKISDDTKKLTWLHTDIIQNKSSDYCFKDMYEHRNTYESFNNIICVSEDVKKAFTSRMAIKNEATVLTNPINEIDIKLLSNQSVMDFNKEDETFRFVAVGRLVKQKGFDRLIRVMARLCEENIKCELCIVGGGVLKEELKHLVNKHNLEESVRFLGYKGNPYPYIAQADTLVLSSIVEGYPSVIIESLILGVPVISTNCSGVKEILGKDYGIIVENEDTLYEAMKRMVEEPILQNHYKQRALLRGKEFRIEKKIDEIEVMLDELKN